MSSAAASLTKVCPECGASYEEGASFCPKDGAALAERETEEIDPYIGAVISGDIEIQSIAGSGAMGRVYRAHQRGIDRRVAVKILHRELSGNQQLVHRFHREAKIASKLQHQNVVEVHLAGQLPDGSMYIVMEFLEGRSIASALLDSGGYFPLARAVPIALQICDAVGEGHALGMTFSGLRSRCTTLVRRGELTDFVKVLDFGIARAQLGEQSMETAAGRIFGTARYISPEGAAGERVGAPGDVYAIATMLYQMLAGRTPFEGAPIGLLVKHIHERPPPLTSFGPSAGVPEPIARVVMQNLAKDPDAREKDARALGAALLRAAREANLSLPETSARFSIVPPSGYEPTLHDGAVITPPPSRPLSDETLKGIPKTWPTGWIAIAIGAFTLGGLGATALLRRAPEPDPERDALLARARAALAGGHYVSPPGENVGAIVTQALSRWPNDAEFEALRASAENDLYMMALTAQANGDVLGERDLAEGARALAPNDKAVERLRQQAEEELAWARSDASVGSGPPRLVFECPTVAKAGSKVEVSARIIPGQAGPKAKVTIVKAVVLPNGKLEGSTPLTILASEPVLRAELPSAQRGSWDVRFEVAVDGYVVRAVRDLDVE